MLFFFDDKKAFYYKRGEKVAFEIGGFYTGKTKYTMNTILQFIQVSPKGYNFLDIKTGKCLYSKHLYVTSKDYEKCHGGVRFFDLRFRETIIPTLNLLEPLRVSELSDVLLQIQSRQKKSYKSNMAKKRT